MPGSPIFFAPALVVVIQSLKRHPYGTIGLFGQEIQRVGLGPIKMA